MNTSISKIHFNSSTGVSLNDRFTAMTKVSVPARGVTVTGLVRNPLRSNSVSRMDSNRQLIDRWDRVSTMQSTTHLKNTAIRRPMRQRLQRNNMALQVKRTIGKVAGGFRRLQRSNSFSDIATMNADRVMMQQARGRTPSISSRLGAAGGNTRRGRSVSRGRSVPRNRSTSRGRNPSLNHVNSQNNLRRSASRDRLPRAGSRTNLSRAGSRNNLSRAGSRNGLNNARKAVGPNDARRRLNRNAVLAVNRAATNGATNGAANRSRSRSRSRVRAAVAAAMAATTETTGRGGRARPRKRAGSRARNMRSGSVNSRLGANRTNEPVAVARPATAGARGGRVSKRSGSRRRRGLQNATAVGIPRPSGRPLKREPINRKGAGGKAQRGNGNVGNLGNSAATNGRRGRSRSRRENSRVRGRSASKNRTVPVKQQSKSREELDNEIDQYMANTRSLDKEMEEYIRIAAVSRI